MKAFDKRTISYRPLADLTIHPAIAGDPRLAAKDPRYLAMRQAWREADTLPPIFVTKDNQIVDGRHRYWFAEDEELDEVPCIEVREDEVFAVIVQGLFGRSQQTKGQRAYFAAPKLKGAFEAAQARRIALLQSGGKAKLPLLPSAEDMAAKLGISEEYLRQSRNLHEAFERPEKYLIDGKKTTLRAHFEPRILAPEGEDKDGVKLPVSLGDALKAVGYFLKSGAGEGGNPKPKAARNSDLNNFRVAGQNLAKAARGWAKWNQNEQELVVDAICDSLAALPGAALQGFDIALKKAKRQQAKQAKEAAEAAGQAESEE